MTPEERFEQQMEFVLNQQARFYAGLERLAERLERLVEAQWQTDRRINLQQEQIGRTVGLLGTTGQILAQSITQVSASVEELARAQKITEEQLRATDQRLSEQLLETDRRLSQRMSDLTEQVSGLGQQVSGLGQQVSGLTEQVSNLGEHVAETDRQLRATDQRLNSFIQAIERHFPPGQRNPGVN